MAERATLKNKLLPTPKQTQQLRQRLFSIAGFVALGGFSVFLYFSEKNQGDTLIQAGLPVSFILGAASILGIIASIIIFRTPHDGNMSL